MSNSLNIELIGEDEEAQAVWATCMDHLYETVASMMELCTEGVSVILGVLIFLGIAYEAVPVW